MTTTEIVNCGSCTACCRKELVALIEGDNLADYPEAEEASTHVKAFLADALPEAIGWMIPHGSDGACVYVKHGRCSIYEKRPQMCRAFSCVGWVERIMATTTRAERRRDKAFIDTEVWRAGKKRLTEVSP